MVSSTQGLNYNSKTLLILFVERGSSILLAESRARGHGRTVTSFKLGPCFSKKLLWLFERGREWFLVFLMVEVVTASVDKGFSSGLEGCACLEPANWLTELGQEYFFVRLSRCPRFPLQWWLSVLLSSVLGQNDPQWLVTSSSRRRSLQVKTYTHFIFRLVFIKGFYKF